MTVMRQESTKHFFSTTCHDINIVDIARKLNFFRGEVSKLKYEKITHLNIAT